MRERADAEIRGLTDNEIRSHRSVAPWIVPAIFGLLSLSYLLTGNELLAVAAAGATVFFISLAMFRASKGEAANSLHIGTWLPVAAPLVLARLNEEPTFWTRSFPLLIVAVTFGLLTTWGVDLRPLAARFGHVVAIALRSIASTIVFVLILLPLGIARLWRREDPMGTGRGDERSSAWHKIDSLSVTPAKTFRVEKTGRTTFMRSLFAGATRGIGVLVLLVALDFGLGSAAARIAGDEPSAPSAVYDQVGVGERRENDLERDPRLDLPALADSPWAEDWFAEFQSQNWFYWPYLQYRMGDFAGEYLNIEDGKRRSFQSELGERSDAIEIGFFGGSTTFGIAQRDGHTIPSEVARLAAADGLPVVVKNYGVSGYTNWQELILFEQVSASGGAPDIAVFYDGANELAAQMEGVTGVPSHVGLRDTAALLGEPNNVAAAPAPEYNSVTLHDLWETYRDKSLVRRLLRGALNSLTPSADASVNQAFNPTVEQAEAYADVYRRGRGIIEDLSDLYNVQTLFFWQPRQLHPVDEAVLDQIDEPTIDISDILEDHQDVFIDGNHHNEEGSKIVAATIWEYLEPAVRAEYEG